MDSYLPVLKDVISVLRANSGVSALCGQRIYSDVPDNETFPYIVALVNSVPYDVKESVGMEHTVQLNIYSRGKGAIETATLRSACYSALNRQEASFTNSSPANVLFNGISTTAKDGDGITWFSVIQFRVVISP